MGAVQAVIASQPGYATLRHFNDEIVAKIELVHGGKWILMGRATLRSHDGDRQYATAKLVHGANVVIDKVSVYIDQFDPVCIYLQTGFIINDNETVNLECNTYKGGAWSGSIIAFKVDDIDFQ